MPLPVHKMQLLPYNWNATISFIHNKYASSARLVHPGLQSAKDFFTEQNANTYDKVVRYATIGRDKQWKKNILTMIQGNIVLDLASGTGILSEMIRNSNNASEVLSLDLSIDYVKISKKRRKIPTLINASAEMLPFTNRSCDCIVSSYLAKYVDIDKLVTEISRVITPNGIVIFHDFSYPSKRVIRIAWKLHFKLLCAVGLIITSWRHVFSELDQMIENSKWSEEVLASLGSHGFAEISSTYFTFGTSKMIVAKKNE
jgi:demethylmenaquinone methyltransferase / 2-methoxy-6-polyprenyl-1,4-benzoquinol methylase